MSEKVERLVNLTVALLESRRPLTFRDLRERTAYYTQDDAESARRMFERDKDALRRLGVPVETRTLDALGEEQGYWVDRRRYELPDVDLTPEEVTALALALRAVGDTAARLALTKVAARAPDPAPGDAPSHLPQVDLDVDPVDPVAAAVVERQALAFRYRTASGDLADREVEPYAVASRRGSWYLVGRDRDRDAVRAFRLDRVESVVSPVGPTQAFERPDAIDIDAHVRGPSEDVEARIAVAGELTWEAELRGGVATGEAIDGLAVFRFPRANPWRTRAWVIGHGDAALVLDPPELRAEVVAGLRAVAEGTS